MDARSLLVGILVPGVLCGALLYAFLALGSSRPRHVWTAASGLAIAIAYAAGQVGVVGWNGWFPVQSRDWLVPLVPALGLWCAFESSLPFSAGQRWFARAVWALGLGWLCVRPLLLQADRASDGGGDWLSQERLSAWGEAALVGVAGISLWQIWARIGAYLPVRNTCSSACAVVFAAAGAQMLSHSASGSDLHRALFAALVACLVAAWWRPERNFGEGLAGVLALLHIALCYEGARWAALPLASALLLCFAPAFLLLALVVVPETMPGPTRVLARVGALLIPLGIAVFVAWSNAAPATGY
ncbi:MAG: hypothetical protein EPO68_04370 [Planctomycetota bacterium]|nr:MAG: hypothetical protein EPO68_04370 [Planctomycetota bacterium]